MAKPVEVVLNRKAVGQLLRSTGVKAELAERAKRIHKAAGGDKAGYRADSFEGFDRSRAQVVAATRKAQTDQARHRTLDSAINAGR